MLMSNFFGTYHHEHGISFPHQIVKIFIDECTCYQSWTSIAIQIYELLIVIDVVFNSTSHATMYMRIKYI